MTAQQIEARLSLLEQLMLKAHPKDLPSLNQTYQKLLDKLIELDLAKK